MLHLADLHWDPDYVVGSNAVCKELVCCRADSGDLLNQTDAAGYWGDYRSCDLPWYTIEKAVAHMAEKHSVCVNTSSTGIQIEINILFFHFYTIRTLLTSYGQVTWLRTMSGRQTKKKTFT